MLSEFRNANLYSSLHDGALVVRNTRSSRLRKIFSHDYRAASEPKREFIKRESEPGKCGTYDRLNRHFLHEVQGVGSYKQFYSDKSFLPEKSRASDSSSTSSAATTQPKKKAASSSVASFESDTSEGRRKSKQEAEAEKESEDAGVVRIVLDGDAGPEVDAEMALFEKIAKGQHKKKPPPPKPPVYKRPTTWTHTLRVAMNNVDRLEETREHGIVERPRSSPAYKMPRTEMHHWRTHSALRLQKERDVFEQRRKHQRINNQFHNTGLGVGPREILGMNKDSPGPAHYILSDGEVGYRSHCAQYITYPTVEMVPLHKTTKPRQVEVELPPAIPEGGLKSNTGPPRPGLLSPGPAHYDIGRYPENRIRPVYTGRVGIHHSSWCSIP